MTSKLKSKEHNQTRTRGECGLPSLQPCRNHCALMRIIMVLLFFRFYLLGSCIILPDYQSSPTGRCSTTIPPREATLEYRVQCHGPAHTGKRQSCLPGAGSGPRSFSECPSSATAALDLTLIFAQSSLIHSCERAHVQDFGAGVT